MGRIKSYAVQLYGFVVKTCLQRWKTPISTLVEILLPFIFMLLLSVCYWTSHKVIVPEAHFDITSNASVTNNTDETRMMFCTNKTMWRGSPWLPCGIIPGPIQCLKLVGNGNELCYPTMMHDPIYYIIFGTSAMKGGYAVESMDGYLALSAFATETQDDEKKTFFGRTVKAGLSHYGKLLVASENATLAQDFMTYCQTKSAMCKHVLDSDVFPTHDAAMDYAVDNENTVWAIVYLPGNSLNVKDRTEITISMNYSATAATFKDQPKSFYTHELDKSANSKDYLLYYGSGFVTLQTFVHEYYMSKFVSQQTEIGPGHYNDIKQPTSDFGVSHFVNIYGARVMPMPVASYVNSPFMTQWVYYLPLIGMIAALFPIARLTGLIVEEKAHGIREAMMIMGMNRTCLFFGWYVSSIIIDFVAALLAAMIMKVGFLENAEYGVILGVYFTFLQQNTMLCILVSTFFSNPRIASWCAALIVFVSTMPFYSFPDGMTDRQRLLCALAPGVGYGEAFDIMTRYSTYNAKFTWAVARQGTLSVDAVVGMMWASFGIMGLIAYYLDRVAPAAVGVPDHPLFFLAPLFRCLYKDEKKLIPMSDLGDHAGPMKNGKDMKAENTLIEHRNDVVDPEDPSVAAVFHRLRKVYMCGGVISFIYTFFTGLLRRGDRVVALDNITFEMKTGEVSVLLGPNGSGKTTIMGVICGMIRPTSGEVYICGLNSYNHLSECRHNIGFCPQQNIVWPMLTVQEHLTFYARLKNAPTFNVQSMVDKTIGIVDLEHKRHCRAENLSGGQRRRLCLAIALIGDSPVLLLDEPTAGMDMKGRKSMYELLSKARANRSVLLSTHLLDEADRIGDRILLLDNGKLCAEGSSMYLKSQMAVGYIVTCVIEGGLSAAEEDKAVNTLVDFVRDKGYAKHERREEGEVQAVPPGCQLLGMARRGREVAFRFPLSLLSNSGQDLLHSMDENRKALQLRSIGINLTSLEDVFLTATESAVSRDVSEPIEVEDTKKEVKGTPVADDSYSGEALYESNSPLPVFKRHFRALMLKRFHFAKRDVKLVVFQVILPVAFLLLALFINLVRAPRQPALTLDMTMYSDYATHPGTVVTAYTDVYSGAFSLSSSTPSKALGDYLSMALQPAVPNGTDAATVLTRLYSSELKGTSNANYFGVIADSINLFMPTKQRSGALVPTPPTYSATVMHNMSYSHAVPQGIDALYNLAQYQLFGANVPQIVTRNAPMRFGEYETQLYETSKPILMAMFVIIPFILIPSNTISYIVRENECGARHMQWLSGASAVAYWLSSFVFDAVCYIVTEILTFIIFVIFGRDEFVSRANAGPAIVLFLLYGIASVPFSYFLSFFFTRPFTAQTVVLVLNFAFGFLWVTMESMLEPTAFDFVRIVTYIVRALPAVAFGEGVFILSGNSMGRMLSPGIRNIDMWAFVKFQRSGGFTGGVMTGIVYMCCNFGVSVALLVLFEYIRIQRLSVTAMGHCCDRVRRDADEETSDGEIDESVLEEERRVCAESGGPRQDCIALQRLTKQYFMTKSAALDSASLGVHRGEIVGLLGLNGAGKSTALNIIAGDVAATSGDAFVNHRSVLDPTSRAFIGYCPQKDALLDNLTPIEHLWLYARLRGVRERYIAEEVDMLINELGLYPHRHKAAHALSGGNKRRLSLAIALVGRTTSVLLDEPTAGMDARARAQTCAMIKRLTSSKSVLLTTHLIDEVEALVDRVAFLGRGRLRCIGTPQELKSRYTQESLYTIRILFDHAVNLLGEDEAVTGAVKEYVEGVARCGGLGEAAGCEVDEVRTSSLSLTARAKLGDVCTVVNAFVTDSLENVPHATYVCVTQPTLEDILARQ